MERARPLVPGDRAGDRGRQAGLPGLRRLRDPVRPLRGVRSRRDAPRPRSPARLRVGGRDQPRLHDRVLRARAARVGLPRWRHGLPARLPGRVLRALLRSTPGMGRAAPAQRGGRPGGLGALRPIAASPAHLAYTLGGFPPGDPLEGDPGRVVRLGTGEGPGEFRVRAGTHPLLVLEVQRPAVAPRVPLRMGCPRPSDPAAMARRATRGRPGRRRRVALRTRGALGRPAVRLPPTGAEQRDPFPLVALGGVCGRPGGPRRLPGGDRYRGPQGSTRARRPGLLQWHPHPP